MGGTVGSKGCASCTPSDSLARRNPKLGRRSALLLAPAMTLLCLRQTSTASARGADGGRVVHLIAPRFAERCGSSVPLLGHELFPSSCPRTAAARPSPVGRNGVAECR